MVIHALSLEDVALGKAKGTALLSGVDPDDLARNLSNRLLVSSTAVAALQAWCDERGIASGPITIQKLSSNSLSPLDDESLDLLMPVSGEAISYRQVNIVRGAVTLSVADIWFIPQRLAPNMARTLESTNIPFGAVIAPMRPRRRTFFAKFFDAGDSQQATVFEHCAVVIGGSPERALAIVRERYQRDLVINEVHACSD